MNVKLSVEKKREVPSYELSYLTERLPPYGSRTVEYLLLIPS